MTTTLYGIKNCDTVKKARTWLDKNGIEYRFHDFRADGIDSKLVESWFKTLGWEAVINKRSTTWKQLDSALRDGMNETTALSAALEHPTLIKRPVLNVDGKLTIGFKEATYQNFFQ